MHIDNFTYTFAFTSNDTKENSQSTSKGAIVASTPDIRAATVCRVNKQLYSESSYSDQISWRSVEYFKSRYRAHRYTHTCMRRCAKRVLPHKTTELSCHILPNRPMSPNVFVWWLALLFPYWYFLDRMSVDDMPEVFWGFSRVLYTSRLSLNRTLKQPLCFHTVHVLIINILSNKCTSH